MLFLHVFEQRILSMFFVSEINMSLLLAKECWNCGCPDQASTRWIQLAMIGGRRSLAAWRLQSARPPVGRRRVGQVQKPLCSGPTRLCGVRGEWPLPTGIGTQFWAKRQDRKKNFPPKKVSNMVNIFIIFYMSIHWKRAKSIGKSDFHRWPLRGPEGSCAPSTLWF